MTLPTLAELDAWDPIGCSARDENRVWNAARRAVELEAALRALMPGIDDCWILTDEGKEAKCAAERLLAGLDAEKT